MKNLLKAVTPAAKPINTTSNDLYIKTTSKVYFELHQFLKLLLGHFENTYLNIASRLLEAGARLLQDQLMINSLFTL